MRPNFFQHIHPPTIPAAQTRWRYTLGAGGTAIFLMLVLAISGALEMFYYIPSTDEAALSVQT
ncbi:MAG: cytochrome B6, partial [Chloroflexota bacterium]